MLHPASDKGWTETGCQICSLTTSESGLTTTCHCQLDGHNRIKTHGSCLLPHDACLRPKFGHSQVAIPPPCCARDAPPRSLLFLARGFDRKERTQWGKWKRRILGDTGTILVRPFGGERGEGSSQLRGSDLDHSPLHEANSGSQVSGVSPSFFVSETPSGSVSSYGTIPA
jgi:hypothetical protein